MGKSRKSISVFMIASLALVPAILCGRLAAQAVSDLPRAEYYVAKGLLGAGRTIEATDGFRTALNRARRLGDSRWIDSIPPLVLLGECHYQQGNLAMALEQYDAALMLALSYPDWINQLEVGSEQLPNMEGIAKGIDWFAKSRASQPVAVPESLQLTVSLAATQTDSQPAKLAPVAGTTRLDATEVMRTMGLAMLRRWQIFGPMASHSPLAEPLVQYFARQPTQRAPWVQSAWMVLRGISQLSTPGRDETPGLIRSAVLLGGKFEYFLSPLALISLAEIEFGQGNFQAAIPLLQDASLISAYYEQHQELATSLNLLASCACASRRIELLAPLQEASAWCTKRSALAFAAGAVGSAELAIYADELTTADRIIKQASTVLRGRDIHLPRLRAQLAFTSAMLNFAQNRSGLGISNLEAALQLMRGNAQSGPLVESIFQAQMTLDLLAQNKLTAASAEEILDEILREPSAVQWSNDPLRLLALMTTGSLPAYERHLELAAQRDDTEQMLIRLDRLQRQRFYEALPLGGRLLAWRHAIASDPASLPPAAANMVQATLRSVPDIRSNTQQLGALLSELRAGPVPIDERQLTANIKRQFSSLQELAERHESQLTLQALSRKALDRFLPASASLDQLQELLRPEDTLLAFAVTNQSVFGVALKGKQVEFWTVSDLGALNELLERLLAEIGLVRQPPRPLPSTILHPDAAWQSTAKSLHDLLFPAEVQDLIGSSHRVILAPNDRLWYLPFELLPDHNLPGQPWLAGKSVTYVPTLGSAARAYADHAPPQSTVGLIGQMLSANSEVNQQLAEELVRSVPESVGISLTQKISSPSADWLRICSQQLWVSSRIPVPNNPWETVVMPLGQSRQTTLAAWLQTPRVGPRSVALPGLSTSIGSGDLGNGNDVFLPACGLLYGETRTALISRWPVGGKSTAGLMLRYLEELQFDTNSTALRRAILAQWPEEFLIADEPALLPTGKDAEPLTVGKHPLLWAGYMSVGDTVLLD